MKKTFDIYYNDLHIVPNGYVEIDELIAPTIQVLNRKGYITAGCCSGHPLKDTFSPVNFDGKFEVIHGRVYDTHIVFKENVFLPTLPTGFVKKSKPIFPPEFLPDDNTTLESIMELSIGNVLVIYKGIYDGSNFFDTLRNILETMEQLYKWALNLPNFKNE